MQHALKSKTKNYKNQEENIGEYFCHLGLTKNVLNMTPKGDS